MTSLQDRSHEQLMPKQLLLLAIVFLSLVWLLFQVDTSKPGHLLPSGKIVDVEFQEQTDFLVNTEGCRIQNTNPLNDVVRPFITEEAPLKCNMFNCGRLVKADQDSIFIDYEVLHNTLSNFSADPSQVKCYYSEFWRLEHPLIEDGLYPPSVDSKAKFSSEIIEIKNRTVIVNEEFIQVFCELNNERIYHDFFAFPHIKKGRQKEDKSVSVLLFGIDGVSRLNLHRQMPRTVALLKEQFRAIEMWGYNKVGDNTFPNMVPALSGLSEEELRQTCWQKENIFDECPFIWKKYKEANFSTGYYEDAAWMGLFNYGKYGFRKQPTDFYGQIFSLFAEEELGSEKRANAHLCIGNRMTFDVLLDNAKRYIMTSKDILSWSIFWSTSLSHDFLNLPRLADLPFTKFMEDLLSNNIFNSTVLIFMSDHGIRWGGIRTTYHGYLEERLPFLFIIFPEWFENIYQLAVRNLRANKRRLTTHFDLYETLVDLIDLRNLQDDIIKKRTNLLYEKKRRGISLFLPVFGNRTCSDAGITKNWCTCHTPSPISTSEQMVKKSAETLVNHLNSLFVDYPQCSQLSIDSILSAWVDEVNSSGVEENSSLNAVLTDYVISIVTMPGKGLFEATVRHNSATSDFTVIDTVSRLNSYGEQSKCVSHYRLKLYCFCI